MECRITFEGYTVTGASQLQNVKILMLKGEPGSGGVVDDALSTTSENPVQNAVVTTALNGKVNAVSGKGLSTNDFTTALKTKLEGIAAGAEVNVVTACEERTYGVQGDDPYGPQYAVKSTGFGDTNYRLVPSVELLVSFADFAINQIPTTAAQVGAIPAPSSASAGQFLVYNGSAWVAQTIPSANGGSF